MCIAVTPPRRERTLWWALVSYFRLYPPLVQGEGPQAGPEARKSSEEHMPRAKRPPIHIYW